MTAPTQMLPSKKPSNFLERYSESELPTAKGTFRIVVFRDRRNGKEHVAMVKGSVRGQEGVAVRIHSECLTSEVFGSLRCDCRAQLDRAMDFIGQHGGVLLYLRQEGRGIGLLNKIKAYALQDKHNLDTVEANEQLGFDADLRNYAMCKSMLGHLQISSLRLMTNNPLKVSALEELGIIVSERIELKVGLNPHNEKYMATKKDKLGHLDLE